VFEWKVNQHFEDHLCLWNVGLLAIQTPDAATSPGIIVLNSAKHTAFLVSFSSTQQTQKNQSRLLW